MHIPTTRKNPITSPFVNSVANFIAKGSNKIIIPALINLTLKLLSKRLFKSSILWYKASTSFFRVMALGLFLFIALPPIVPKSSNDFIS